MAEAEEGAPKRLTGEAAWKAHRDAIEQRNNAARSAARHLSAADQATQAREKRLRVIENDQVSRLNRPKD